MGPRYIVALVLVVSLAGGYVASRHFLKPTKVRSAVTQVSLLGDRAEPSAVAIELGESVQFNTKDGKVHNIAQGRGNSEVAREHNELSHAHLASQIESGDFGEGDAYKLHFNQVGTFDFHDHHNPKIFITVVVYRPDKK